MSARPRAAFAALGAAWAVAWVAAAAGLAPIHDETYYWTWSRALAVRYFDHPPGVAWVLAASTRLLGDGRLGLRAPSAIAVIGVLLATAWTTRALLRGTARESSAPGAARLAVLLLLGAPMFAVGYVPGTHDVLLGAAMALGAALVVRALQDRRWAPLAALVLVAAVLIKHAAAVIALGVVGGLACTTLGRARLAYAGTWVGVGLGLLALVPWLAAELQAGGGSIAFQADHVLDYAPPRPLLGVPLAVGSIAGTLGPVAGLSIWWAALDGLRRRGAAGGGGGELAAAAGAALGGGALALLVACVLTVVMGSGEANWPMPALALSAPLIALWIDARPRVARLAVPAAWVLAVLMIALLTHTASPWLPWRISKDPTLRGAGMDVIAAATREAAEVHGARLVVTRRYQPASLLRYHLRDAWPVLELGNPRRRSQYDVWPRPPACAGDAVVWVSTERGPPPELTAVELAPAAKVWRPARPGGQGIDAWWVHPLRLTADVAGAACAPRAP